MNAATEILRIYHNPRCSKSRGACQILADKGLVPEVIEYLKTPLSRDALLALLAALQMPASALIRTSEEIYKTGYQGRSLSEDEWVDALLAHPVLMERPIVQRGSRAVVARPPEALEALFQG
jgi:arsenate reductase